jgi:hypothetical protein
MRFIHLQTPSTTSLEFETPAPTKHAITGGVALPVLVTCRFSLPPRKENGWL